MSIIASTILELEYGSYRICYHRTNAGDCISFSIGDLDKTVPIVRIHSSCLFGEAMHSLHCDCGQQLDQTFEAIKKHGAGVVVYTYAEGRGIGLLKKIEAMEAQRAQDIDTVQAFTALGFDKADLRNYDAEIEALQDLGVGCHIQLVSNNPNKIKYLTDAGFIVDKRVELAIVLNPYNEKELLVKKHRMGYYID